MLEVLNQIWNIVGRREREELKEWGLTQAEQQEK